VRRSKVEARGAVGRAGYADGRALYDLSGGMVNGITTVSHNYWPLGAAGAPVSDYYNVERFGWTAGAGVKYAFSDKGSANLEYHHNDFGAATVNSVPISGLVYRVDEAWRIAIEAWHMHEEL